jgi:hypothetical protein
VVFLLQGVFGKNTHEAVLKQSPRSIAKPIRNTLNDNGLYQFSFFRFFRASLPFHLVCHRLKEGMKKNLAKIDFPREPFFRPLVTSLRV